MCTTRQGSRRPVNLPLATVVYLPDRRFSVIWRDPGSSRGEAMIGIPELIIIGVIALPVIIGLVGIWLFWVSFPRRAKRFGSPGTLAYLRAAPRSDDEKRDAADLALKGVVCCLLGILLPPLALGGLVPLFYGGRKFVYASMGLGL